MGLRANTDVNADWGAVPAVTEKAGAHLGVSSVGVVEGHKCMCMCMCLYVGVCLCPTLCLC